jgi:zinc and cadmium transporter
METLFYILASTTFISLLSFAGILALFLRQKLLNKILLVLVAFSAGSLLGGAFLHLIPEALEKTKDNFNIFLYLILGFVLFFILEQFIHWHGHPCEECQGKQVKPFSYLVLIGDGVHNFIDGLIVAGSFLVSFEAGLITVLVVALHEIPQEIGDFGVLVYGGIDKIKALFFNFFSAVTVIFGGVVGFLIAEITHNSMFFLLPFAAGGFIYIAASDLIPEIKHRESLIKSIIHFIMFLTGIGLMMLIKII